MAAIKLRMSEAIPTSLAGRPMMRLSELSGMPFLLKPEMHKLIPPLTMAAMINPSVIVTMQGVILMIVV